MSLDFKKAFLNGHVTREVCIEIPAEDLGGQEGRMVGLLNRAMYGLREAPAIWQRVVQELMADLGFVACATVPCVYFHPEKEVVAVAHVDDFLMSGDQAVLLELRRELQSRYECDGDMLGPGRDEVREISFLGRRIRWGEDGLSWLGDTKQTRTLL